MTKYRRVARSGDKRTDLQLTEAIKQAKTAELNAEAYAQDAADSAEAAANSYASTVAGNAINEANNYTDTAKSEAISSANGYTDTEVADLQSQIDDLKTRVTALENA